MLYGDHCLLAISKNIVSDIIVIFKADGQYFDNASSYYNYCT